MPESVEELLEQSRKFRELEEQKWKEVGELRKLAAFHIQEYMQSLEDFAHHLAAFADKLLEKHDIGFPGKN